MPTTATTKPFHSLLNHQLSAIDKLRTGSILFGGVGSGKSLTSLVYYFVKVCGGVFNSIEDTQPMKEVKPLYVITTARKRDSLEWEREALKLGIEDIVVDSWNNIKKYVEVENSFIIFDEQRLVGSGVWVRTFLKIIKNNEWILLTATPGDNWMDYVPVFIANGFYRNRTDFIRQHVVYHPYTKFPKILRFSQISKLEEHKKNVLVVMDYKRPTKVVHKYLVVEHDKTLYKTVVKDRWNPYDNSPIRESGEYCHLMRRVANSNPSRLLCIRNLQEKHRRLIVFYNFNYELEILRSLKDLDFEVKEYNGHKHESLPVGEKWIYLVQYQSGGEAWNCTETNAIAFYSQNYSYRIMTQAAGRIDRMNTPFDTLYYYHLVSTAAIDDSIRKALSRKKTFNEKTFLKGDSYDWTM